MSDFPMNDVAVTTVSNLAALNGGTYQNGERVFVASQRSYWRMQKYSQVPVAAGSVIASGADRWVREDTPSADNANQTAWGLDPVLGDDENPGTVAAPLKTLAEFCRRMTRANPVTYTLTVASGAAIPSTDVLRWTPRIAQGTGTGTAPNAVLSIVGTPTTTLTSSFTATVAPVPATNTRGTITPAAAVAVGDMLRVTSGAGNGGCASVLKDIGAGVFAVSRWVNPNVAGAPVVATPAAADTFVVETFPSISCNIIDQRLRCVVNLTTMLITPATNGWGPAGGPPSNTYTRCKLFFAVGSPFGPPINGDLRPIRPTFRGCLFHLGSYGTLTTCRTADGAWTWDGCGWINCAINANQTVGGGGHQFSNGEFQASSFGRADPALPEACTQGSMYLFSACGFWDSTVDPALTFRRGSKFACAAAVAVPLYGTGSTVGTRCADGGVMQFAATQTPALTGTTELLFEGAPTAIPPLVAGAAVPAAVPMATWADWVAAGRNVFSYRSGAAIFTAAAT